MKPYYQDSAVTIYHGDCRDFLNGVTWRSLIITDPPYGISHASNHICESTTAKWMNQEINGDDSTVLRDEILSNYSDWACFGSIKTSAPSGTRGFAVWDKGPASGMGDLSFPFKLSWELIYFSGDGWMGSRDEGVIKNRWIVSRASFGRLHPNEKPVTLLTLFNFKTLRRTNSRPIHGQRHHAPCRQRSWPQSNRNRDRRKVLRDRSEAYGARSFAVDRRLSPK